MSEIKDDETPSYVVRRRTVKGRGEPKKDQATKKKGKSLKEKRKAKKEKKAERGY
jgi:hypothetical protein